jgi:cob(I)alamin adenosyltransferase
MRIYTRTGDTGQTSLRDGQRVPKDSPRVEVCGTVDELIACLGLALAFGLDEEATTVVQQAQRSLMTIASDLAMPPEKSARSQQHIEDSDVLALEAVIDGLEQKGVRPTSFVFPGGSLPAAALHLARTVCRRTERLVVPLARADETDWRNVRYLNRLSDLLFILACAA